MTFLSIQYLRAIAALAIVFFHMDLQLGRMGYAGYWPQVLAGGVDVFFVISGFIMWVTTHDRPPDTLGFYWRRIVRIVPLYWALTGFAVLAALFSPAMVQSGRLDLGHVIASVLFLPAEHPVLHVMEPVLVPGWTLNYEMFFYAVFGLTLPLPLAGRLLATGGVLGGLVLLGLVSGAAPESVFGFYTDGIVLEFVLGLGLGLLFTRGWRLTRPIAVLCLAGGFVAMAAAAEWGAALPRIVGLGIPALLIVTGALMAECAGRVRDVRLLHLVGDASYSVYLSHGIVLSAVGQGWRRLRLDQVPGGWAGFVIAASLATVLLGIVLYRVVERPSKMLLTLGRPRRLVPR